MLWGNIIIEVLMLATLGYVQVREACLNAALHSELALLVKTTDQYRPISLIGQLSKATSVCLGIFGSLKIQCVACVTHFYCNDIKAKQKDT